MRAYLKNYRQAPRKVRLVAGLIKGRKVDEAIAMLDFLVKRAGLPIKKLLLSAVANASQMGIEKENLYIKELRVDKGVTMKRMMPAAMGTGHRINKRTSNVALVLEERVITNDKLRITNKNEKTKKEIKIGGKVETKKVVKKVIKNKKIIRNS